MRQILTTDPTQLSVDELLATRKALNAKVNQRPVSDRAEQQDMAEVLVKLKLLGQASSDESTDLLAELEGGLPSITKFDHINLYA